MFVFSLSKRNMYTFANKHVDQIWMKRYLTIEHIMMAFITVNWTSYIEIANQLYSPRKYLIPHQQPITEFINQTWCNTATSVHQPKIILGQFAGKKNRKNKLLVRIIVLPDSDMSACKFNPVHLKCTISFPTLSANHACDKFSCTYTFYCKSPQNIWSVICFQSFVENTNLLN